MTIKEQILKRIKRNSNQIIFMIGDFADLGSPETVRKVFFQACLSGDLYRVAHGIYVKPVMSRFGLVPPSLETIAAEIARRDHAQILATGSTAANLVGLSTQVPMNLSYLTSGSTRTISIGNRNISFRHASPRNFASIGKVVPLLTQALKEIGKDSVGDKELDLIRQFVDIHPETKFEQDLHLAPQWIQQIIKKALNKNTQVFEENKQQVMTL